MRNNYFSVLDLQQPHLSGGLHDELWLPFCLSIFRQTLFQLVLRHEQLFINDQEVCEDVDCLIGQLLIKACHPYHSVATARANDRCLSNDDQKWEGARACLFLISSWTSMVSAKLAGRPSGSFTCEHIYSRTPVFFSGAFDFSNSLECLLRHIRSKVFNIWNEKNKLQRPGLPRFSHPLLCTHVENRRVQVHGPISHRGQHTRIFS